MGSVCHLERIFPAQGSNPGLPDFRRILYHLSHIGRGLWIRKKVLIINDQISQRAIKISDVEHLFIYLLAIWISSLKKYLIRPSTHFLIELFFKTSNSAKKQQKQEESIDVQVAIVFAFHLIKVAIGHSFKLKHTWERKTLPMFSFSLSALFVPSVSPEWAVLERKLLPPLPTPSQLLIFLDFVTKFYSQVWQFTICHNGTDELASFLAQVNLNEISQQVRPFTLCKAFFSSSLSH